MNYKVIRYLLGTYWKGTENIVDIELGQGQTNDCCKRLGGKHNR